VTVLILTDLSPYHINKLMLSLYLRKTSENSSIENFKENNWNVYFSTTNVEIETTRLG
jgi:hypothetical protein